MARKDWGMAELSAVKEELEMLDGELDVRLSTDLSILRVGALQSHWYRKGLEKAQSIVQARIKSIQVLMDKELDDMHKKST